MKILEFCELDIDFCQLTYGTSPCTAELGVTGTKKCFNTLGTCQDTENFDPSTKTLRFGKSGQAPYTPKSIRAIPSLKSVDITPALIKPGESLGEREVVSFVFEDHRHSDSGFDKYVSDRNYTPFNQGTFWGKFFARNHTLQGAPIRYITGRPDQSIDEMETRHYIVESWSGPDAKGRVTIKARDILKLLDGDRARAPTISLGILSTDIDSDDTEVTLNPSGVGATYASSGYGAIGDEIVSFTRSGDVFTIVRAQLNTEADEHDEEDLFQEILQYDGEDPADIINDLLVNYAGMDSSQIPLSEWQEETGTYINRLYSAYIAKPTAVKTLVAELMQQVGLSLIPDTINNKLRLQALRPVVSNAPTITENDMILGTFSQKQQLDKRVSQAWTHYGQKNPLEELSETQNYQSAVATFAEENPYQFEAIRETFSRWIIVGNRPAAQRLNAMLLSRYQTAPRMFGFSVDRYNNSISLGGGYRIQHPFIQDDEGEKPLIPVIAVSVEPTPSRLNIMAEEMLFEEVEDLDDTHLIVIDANSYNIDLRELHDRIYPEPENGDVVVCVIESNIHVGSLNTAPAFDVGDWPEGVDITLTVRGSIRGNGGAGQYGSGLQGRTALYTRYAITVDNQGEIWGGGGGGGGVIRNETYTFTSGSPTTQYVFQIGKGGDGAGVVVNGEPTDTGGTPTQLTDGVGGRGGDPGEAGKAGHSPYGTSPLSGQGTVAGFVTHTIQYVVGSGGAAGTGVDGESFITYTTVGDIKGARIN